MFTILESVKTGNSDENAIAAKKSVDVCIELYNKQIWYGGAKWIILLYWCQYLTNPIFVLIGMMPRL